MAKKKIQWDPAIGKNCEKCGHFRPHLQLFRARGRMICQTCYDIESEGNTKFLPS